jgi:hypothetical protein
MKATAGLMGWQYSGTGSRAEEEIQFQYYQRNMLILPKP